MVHPLLATSGHLPTSVSPDHQPISWLYKKRYFWKMIFFFLLEFIRFFFALRCHVCQMSPFFVTYLSSYQASVMKWFSGTAAMVCSVHQCPGNDLQELGHMVSASGNPPIAWGSRVWKVFLRPWGSLSGFHDTNKLLSRADCWDTFSRRPLCHF